MIVEDITDQAMVAMFDNTVKAIFPTASNDVLAQTKLTFIETVKKANSLNDFFGECEIPFKLRKLYSELKIPENEQNSKTNQFAAMVTDMFRIKENMQILMVPSGPDTEIITMGFGGKMFGGKNVSFDVTKPPKDK
jgi:hypothetical protein